MCAYIQNIHIYMHIITTYCIYACIFLNVICSVLIMVYIGLFSEINVYVYVPA